MKNKGQCLNCNSNQVYHDFDRGLLICVPFGHRVLIKNLKYLQRTNEKTN